ncbi:hypothetical protein ACFL08_04420 [Patescibacteria group bacterium]
MMVAKKVEIHHKSFGKIGEGFVFSEDFARIIVRDANGVEVSFAADTKKGHVPFVGECCLEYIADGNSCCAISRAVYKNAKFCSRCGKSLRG